MDFIDKVRQYSKRINSIKDNLSTEEATKTALIMPFFDLLGYDIFNPLEFVPEYTADVGTKKGEKVDYAIIKDNKPIILIEAKHVDEDLTKHGSQLFRYFTVTPAKFAILTNGIVYKFFTDLDENNIMDKEPFLEINLLNINDNQVKELKKFTKDNFDIKTIFDAASELKYTSLIKSKLNEQLENPSDDFVKFMISDFYSGVKTTNVLEKFKPVLKKSMQQFLNDFINEKIKNILQDENKQKETTIETIIEKNKIITTEEELQGFNVVRSILSEIVNVNDIVYKDTQSYFGILYQNNTRKWICRLYFNSSNKYIAIPNENKEEIKYPIENISDIYKYKNELLSIVKAYLTKTGFYEIKII